MEFDKVVSDRRSIRKFKPDAIPEEYIEALIQAAQKAPSGLNLQPWRFIAVKDEAARRLVGESTASRFVADAPVILFACVDLLAFKKSGARAAELKTMGAISDAEAAAFSSEEFVNNLPEPFIQAQLAMYTGIAITHILLKATDLGLGSCWVGYFDVEKVKAIAGLGPEFSVLALLPVGFPAEQPKARPRLPASELLLKVI